MKEKETYYCGEEWMRALKMRIYEDGGLWPDSVWPGVGKYRPLRLGNQVFPIMPIPAATMKWIEEHPKPPMDSVDAISALANRVAALEAALAEKGGTR